MQKTTIIKLVLSLSAIFILIQLVIFKSLLRRRRNEDDKTQSRQSAAMLDLVYIFTGRCQEKNIPIFIIEPAVLRSVVTVSEMDSSLDCVHLCQGGDILSLGVLAEDWGKKGFLLRDFPSYDLVVMELTSPDPRQLSVEKPSRASIPTHYFVHHASGIRPLLHLVVFYKRSDNYLWFSKLPTTNKTSMLEVKSQHLTFGSQAGAFDRFPLRQSRADGIRLYLPHTVKEFLAQVPQSRFIECDYSRAQTFLNKYPQDSSNEAQQFQRKARQLLARAKEVLEETGVKFWLSSGTCLGWFRQCGIIPYSKDIDFGVWIKDYHEDLIGAFESRGFSLKHVFGKESDSYELSFKAGDIKIDIFFFYEEKSYMWNGGTEAWTGVKYKYFFPRFDVCWTDFLGLRVRVPCPTLPYVTANYGQNWNIPVKQWDWKKSPANVKENGIWPKDEWETVMQVYE